MHPAHVLFFAAAYFLVLLLIAWLTSRKSDNAGYFIANKSSLWYVVAFGMVSDSLSGVTFISVPGWVGTNQFAYLQMVLGYLLGYAVIAFILLPLYYKLNLLSIYSYLEQRLGPFSCKAGAFCFMLSRSIGAAFRLYLTIYVLQAFVFGPLGMPFYLSVTLAILLILLYTYRGGIGTLVWTDAFQSVFLLGGLVLSVYVVADEMGLSLAGLYDAVASGGRSQVFFWEWDDKRFFLKQFLSGAGIAIVMTGLDQNMMQKNLSCRSLRDAQKNILSFSALLVVVNVLFLTLGALLYLFAGTKGIPLPSNTDELFPLLALNHLGGMAAVVFVLGLTAATYSSADSVLTTLTTSFCVDFLGFEQEGRWDEAGKKVVRYRVHAAFAVTLWCIIMIFRAINDKSVIEALFTVAGYTYGPLLGLYAFALFTKRKVHDRLVPAVCLLAPVCVFLLDYYSDQLLNGYQFGFELLLLNGMLVFAGLWVIGEKRVISRQS